ncbi:MAG TPA: type II toxin-antitoxin system PemK/MazF family toxin [Tepidisphaeraceae bacterium]
MIRAGDIYQADLLGAGRRPVLIISRESLNRGHYVCAVAFTTARLDVRRQLPNYVFFRADSFGLTADCVAQCETLTSLDVAQLDLLTGPVGRLDDATMKLIIRAIGHVIQSECELL